MKTYLTTAFLSLGFLCQVAYSMDWKAMREERLARQAEIEEKFAQAMERSAHLDLRNFIKGLIEKKGDLDARFTDGDTPVLAMLRQEDDCGLLKELLINGADPNVTSVWGVSALNSAIQHKNISAIRLLLEHGADPNIQNAKGFNTLFYVIRGQEPKEIINILLQHGANPLCVCANSGTNAIDVAQADGLDDIARLLKVEVFTRMISREDSPFPPEVARVIAEFRYS